LLMRLINNRVIISLLVILHSAHSEDRATLRSDLSTVVSD
jgi:hypothetical protein